MHAAKAKDFRYNLSEVLQGRLLEMHFKCSASVSKTSSLLYLDIYIKNVSHRTSSPWKALRKGVPFCFQNGIKVLYDLQAVTFIFLAEGECLHPTILWFSCVCTEQTFV